MTGMLAKDLVDLGLANLAENVPAIQEERESNIPGGYIKGNSNHFLEFYPISERAFYPWRRAELGTFPIQLVSREELRAKEREELKAKEKISKPSGAKGSGTKNFVGKGQTKPEDKRDCVAWQIGRSVVTS